MTTGDVKRKLSAILSADVRGYSRLMREDEVGTIRTLTAYREVMANLIQGHRGRVVDTPGDNLLAEFASVVNAVECAVEIQSELEVRNAELPENRKMEFRIGINLGDVVEEGERIYGDGVNIAARLEGLAEGGGICISGTAYDHVENKLGLEYEYLGEQNVKNITKPVRVYRVLSFPGTAAHGLMASEEKMAFPLPQEPSIAVLPFVNMSGDPEQEYFSDAMTEQIITALSKIPRMFVIARNSTFTYKGKSVKVQQVSEDLGVRFVLEGSAQRSGNRVRINVQLIDATNGRHLWAERYDRDLKDIFALQDEITLKVLTAMRVELTEGEQARRWSEYHTDNLEVYEKHVKAVYLVNCLTRHDNAQARQLLEEVIALEPDNAGIYSSLGYTHWFDARFGWSKSRAKSIERAFELAQKALALDDSLDYAHSLLSGIYLLKRQYGKAIAEVERAVALNPNGADHHLGLGGLLSCLGRPKEGIPLLKKAIRLNPFPSSWYFYLLGRAYFMTGQYEEAIATYENATRGDPDYLLAHVGLAATYGLSGRKEEAHSAAAEVLRINPKFSLEDFEKTLPYKNQADKEFFIDALRKAGLK
jgi:adenylate cyclase